MNPELKAALQSLGRAIENQTVNDRMVPDPRSVCRCGCTYPEDVPFCKPRVRYNDLIAARRIAGEQSRQTGDNYRNFTSGRYDHAFGVRTALAAIEYGRNNR